MSHKLSTAVHAQGWVDGHIENMVAKAAEKKDENPTAHVVATVLQEQWSIVSNAFDQLVKENAEMARKLAIIQSTL
jgi:hypothetical protein